jgi:hypothetical protein
MARPIQIPSFSFLDINPIVFAVNISEGSEGFLVGELCG